MSIKPRPSGDSWIENMGATLGTQEVVVIHDGVRHELRATVQATTAFFDIDAPVYTGDSMELEDTRGGRRTVHITEVKINRFGGGMPAHLSHIAAKHSETVPRPAGLTQHVHGDQIYIHSSSEVNIATRGGTVNQNRAVTAGYEDIAQRIKHALDVLDTTPALDDDEREVGREAASIVLDEIVQAEPNQRKVKGALATLRGVLGAAANAGAGALVSALVAQLFI